MASVVFICKWGQYLVHAPPTLMHALSLLDILEIISLGTADFMHKSDSVVSAVTYLCIAGLIPSHQFFSHVGTISYHSGLNQY